MALGFRRIKEISRILPRFIHSGILNQQSRQSIIFPSSLVSPLSQVWVDIRESIVKIGCHIHRFSTVSETSQQLRPDVDLLTFLESTLDELEGPCHCWLNKPKESKEPFNRDGIFLVLAGAFPEDSLMLGADHVIMFERVKLLQRRHPQLRIFGFQSGSVCSVVSQIHVVQTIVEEYITYPILLSNQTFPEMASGACYLVFKDFKSPLRFFERMTELGTISKAIAEFSLVENEKSLMSKNLKGMATKNPDVIKEPFISSLRNLLLYFPGCISVDKDGNRLFLSDSSHHRIIILDGDGKILDCIGSSPGFEDGEFDTAKLLRPASSFYHVAEDCLYFVDSENYAIRKAHIGRRILETLYPTCDNGNKIKSIWSWTMDKLKMGREVGTEPEKLDMEFLICPWHLMEWENTLLIVNRSFQTLWIMDAVSGTIREVVTGYPNVMEICGQMIMEKKSLLNQITDNYLQQNVDPSCSLERLPYDSLMSSVATFGNNIIFCDTVGQTILKLDKESGIVSNLPLSNFGILGVPYWLSCPLERVVVSGDVTQSPRLDHLQCFSVLPGRCDIHVNVHIPEDTELAAPLQEGCIWRQARGSAAEVSGSEDVAASAERVGVAQQWFEELDNLAFSTPGAELSDEENKIQDRNFHEDNSVHIDCAVNISPGTSEVIIYAVLYLKLNRNLNYSENSREEKTKRILDILNNGRSGKQGKTKDACIQSMLESSRDIRELIFMKPLHLRVKLECQDHPKADTAKEIILTDSNIEFNVSLK